MLLSSHISIPISLSKQYNLGTPEWPFESSLWDKVTNFCMDMVDGNFFLTNLPFSLVNVISISCDVSVVCSGALTSRLSSGIPYSAKKKNANYLSRTAKRIWMRISLWRSALIAQGLCILKIEVNQSVRKVVFINNWKIH